MKIHEMITPQTWCQGDMAKDKLGEPVAPEHPDAVTWCSIGWLEMRYGARFGSPDYVKIRK